MTIEEYNSIKIGDLLRVNYLSAAAVLHLENKFLDVRVVNVAPYRVGIERMDQGVLPSPWNYLTWGNVNNCYNIEFSDYKTLEMKFIGNDDEN